MMLQTMSATMLDCIFAVWQFGFLGRGGGGIAALRRVGLRNYLITTLPKFTNLPNYYQITKMIYLSITFNQIPITCCMSLVTYFPMA